MTSQKKAAEETSKVGESVVSFKPVDRKVTLLESLKLRPGARL